jgi:hypothetical protein
MMIINILIYSSIQFVPHRDHNVFQLERPTGECCVEKRSLFILRILQNMQITLCVRAAAHEGLNGDFCMLNAQVHMWMNLS